MASPAECDLDGVRGGRKYSDGAVVRVFCMRTDRDAYPSGWAYKLYYGTTEPDPPRTLGDGRIRRYDNSHEDTKGHERHVTPDFDPDIIEFLGMVELWGRFWSEIPKSEFEVA